jgi:hypothetical protein
MLEFIGANASSSSLAVVNSNCYATRGTITLKFIGTRAISTHVTRLIMI